MKILGILYTTKFGCLRKILIIPILLYRLTICAMSAKRATTERRKPRERVDDTSLTVMVRSYHSPRMRLKNSVPNNRQPTIIKLRTGTHRGCQKRNGGLQKCQVINQKREKLKLN